MAKYKRFDYSQRVLIPVSLEEQLLPGTLEFAIHKLVENRMDLSVFDSNYQNDETGRSAYNPKILLKVVLFAYLRGLVSSRRIERACAENVMFMALSGNQRPDHSSIGTFVSSMKDQILPLFCDILLVCEQAKGRELQSNVTDNESAKMKTSHGTIQGYNGQALVDGKHQVVIHAEAFGKGVHR